MRTDAFDFDLPRELIAARPAKPRDAARLLCIAPAGLSDRRVRDLPDLLKPSDLMVLNDTRVIPARLAGRRGAARIELTLHRAEAGGLWRAFAKPAKRLKVGDTVAFAEDFCARVEARGAEGEVALRFEDGEEAFRAKLARYGATPLPPYIPRPHGAEATDEEDYQTVYAANEGAVAAPTAGLHFTPELLARLDVRGIAHLFVTLHVGAGTFLPVKAEDTKDHRMHAERGIIGAAAARAVNAAKAEGRRIVAVGTTSLRLLEAAADETGRVRPCEGDIGLFITPGYRFRVVDVLMTNFHLPRSTLLMLVAAFCGLERIKEAYAHAIRAGYRFYSYGDCTLIERAAAA